MDANLASSPNVRPVFLAFHLYAAWKIYRGEEYEYPIAGDLARGMMTPA